MFEPVEGSASFPDLEARIGRFWKDRQIYEKSLAARAGKKKFVIEQSQLRPVGRR